MPRGNGQPDGEWTPDRLGDPYELFEDIVKALSLTMDLVEQASHEHAQRVAAMALNLGRKVDLPDSGLRDLYYAGLLHDIGQIGTPDQILRKKGTLTLREKAAMYSHTHIGYEIVREIPSLDFAAYLIRWHHERWDGKGYPDGLTKDQSSLLARILAVADAFDAMSSQRPYRDRLAQEKVIRTIREVSGKQFDPNVVEVFLKAVQENKISSVKSQPPAGGQGKSPGAPPP